MNSHFKKNFLFYFLILALAGSTAYLYFSGQYERSKVVDWVEDQRQETNFHVSRAIDSASIAPLKLTVQSLSWAIRTELLNENKEEVTRYFRELAKERSIKMAVLCDTTNRVIYAASAEHKGKYFRQYHDLSHIQATNVSVKPAPNQEGFFLTAPIMGLNSRYGTLFLHYNQENKPTFQGLPKFQEIE